MMKSRSGGGANSKVERKTTEKYRRMHMKSLCFKLSSIIPEEHRNISKDVLTQQDNFDQATSYIKKLRERIERLKQRKLMQTSTVRSETTMRFASPIIEVRHQDLNLEILVISDLNKRFMFHEVINVIEEEGSEVVTANFSIVGDKIYHTIHSQAVSSRIGLEASSVYERLKDLIN
ncbi:unnamed protein product [Musa acuminata var. zebrina]